MIRSSVRQVAGIVKIILTGVPLFLACLTNPYEYHKPQNITLVINEFMVSNTRGIVIDEYGEADDWIELYNAGDKGINLRGLFLSDDSTKLQKFALPDTTIPARGFLVIWADDDVDQGSLHAPFKLSAKEGEELLLTLVNGLLIDRISFFAHSNNPEARLPDVSYGRLVDGGALWGRQKEPTPGFKNKGN